MTVKHINNINLVCDYFWFSFKAFGRSVDVFEPTRDLVNFLKLEELFTLLLLIRFK